MWTVNFWCHEFSLEFMDVVDSNTCGERWSFLLYECERKEAFMHWFCYRDKNKMVFLFLYSLPWSPAPSPPLHIPLHAIRPCLLATYGPLPELWLTAACMQSACQSFMRESDWALSWMHIFAAFRLCIGMMVGGHVEMQVCDMLGVKFH